MSRQVRLHIGISSLLYACTARSIWFCAFFCLSKYARVCCCAGAIGGFKYAYSCLSVWLYRGASSLLYACTTRSIWFCVFFFIPCFRIILRFWFCSKAVLWRISSNFTFLNSSLWWPKSSENINHSLPVDGLYVVPLVDTLFDWPCQPLVASRRRWIRSVSNEKPRFSLYSSVKYDFKGFLMLFKSYWWAILGVFRGLYVAPFGDTMFDDYGGGCVFFHVVNHPWI